MTPALFWSRCERVGPCLVWRGALNGHGYGHFTHEQQTIACHVYAYELTNGPITPGLFVLHSCDNPPCCEPAHLFQGTQAQNLADMCAKGRHATGYGIKGSQHWCARLTEDEVREMRQLRRVGVILADLAVLYDVGISAVHSIVTYKTWRHVK